MEAHMALNHLTVPDAAKTRSFFERYFGFRCVAKPPTGVIVLVDESGFVLTLINFEKAGEVREISPRRTATGRIARNATRLRPDVPAATRPSQSLTS
jgi:hypothetical protein